MLHEGSCELENLMPVYQSYPGHGHTESMVMVSKNLSMDSRAAGYLAL